MSWLRWESGRQGTGYEKLLLARSERLRFDCYLLRYTPGSSIPFHTDPAQPGFEHHRFNIVLKQAEFGGYLRLGRKAVTSRWIHFRPDLTPHSVSKIYVGTRYALSFGWLRKVPLDGREAVSKTVGV